MKGFIIFFLLVSTKLCAQLSCDGLAEMRYYLKDTILVKCDTVYLLNKSAYEYYNAHSKKAMTIAAANKQLNSLISTQKDLIQLYENKLLTLRLSYDSVTEKSFAIQIRTQQYLETSTKALSDLRESVNYVNGNVVQTDKNLTYLHEKLNVDVKNARKSNWRWGLGGIIVGASIMLLVGNQK